MDATDHTYEFDMEIATRLAGEWHVSSVTVAVPFTFKPNDDRLNPELTGEYEIDPDHYGARIYSIDGVDVLNLPRAVPDILTQTLIRATLASEFHQGAMLDIARGT